MKLLRSLPLRIPLVIAFVLLSPLTTPAQTANVLARITQTVDPQNLVTLRGNTHPLARPDFDRGAAPDSLPMERILLVLQRSAEQETALRRLLDEQQIKSSPNYHMWLTPEQFGEQFGPADADIQAVTDWLTSQGFRVNRVATGRTVIEFSGTAGAVRQALHMEIHRYVVNGQEHWANASDPEIPAALAPVVAGFASLNNFPRQPMTERVGAFSRSKATGEVRPLFTFPSSNGTYYALGPTDFATIYNILPLWQASQAIDGTGQTIAIVASSNINVQDVRDFRNVFGLPANDPHIIVNGVDPGVTMTGAESEADLDVEWAGAVAKNATIELVVSQDTESTFGADLSAVYIIDNNLAPVLSASYGGCEPFLGVGGNAFYNSLWGQGAAQGITIVVASGDAGSAVCDASGSETAAKYGLTVSGTASTPFNVAVGGTDFNDVNNWSTYWSTTNNSITLSSALSYIPEMTWNDSCARSGVASDCASAGTDTPVGIDHRAGGGGQSNCVTPTSTSTSVTCIGGYPKPAWQTGNGVPNDGARDIPDVSLFASDGFNRSFYVLCEADALPAGYLSCDRTAATWYFLGAGGTSAAAPAFAGIMALVNEKTGDRQGNANYVLYPLAATSGSSCTSNATMAPTANSSSCIFYDVPTGYNNSVACVGGSPNCSNTTSGGYGILEVNPPTNSSPAWTTNAGYDLATGLGSVNAANLVKNWSSVSFAPTTTTLTNLSPTTLTHGQAVSFTINVAPGSGSGTPTGDVSLIAQAGSSPSNSTSIGSFTLSKGSFSGTTNMLPGGTYGVTAHYAGDGTYGASDSAPPIQVTVNPEGSQTRVTLLTFDPTTGQETSSNATSIVYGSTYNILRADVTNSSGQDCYSIPYACPTGQVTLSDNGQPLDLGTYKVNSQGYTEDQLVQVAGGTNNLVASYSGDSSYNASTSPAVVITVTPGPTATTLSPPLSSGVGTTYVLEVTINTQSVGVGPTGTVQFLNGGSPIGQPASLFSYSASASGRAWAQGSGSVALPVGNLTLTAQYSGDGNYTSSTSPPVSLTVTDFSLTVSPSTITIPAPGQSGTATITITPLGGFTGSMNVTCYVPYWTWGINCTVSPEYFNVTASSPATTTLTITTVGANSLAPPVPRPRIPPNPRLPVRWPWLLTGLLTLATLMSLAAARRRAARLLFTTALLVAGIWVACGGGGGGGTPPPPPAPDVSLSPSSLTFGQLITGTTSAAQNVTLANIGNASLSISSIAIGGTNSGDFAQTNTCGGSVAPGANCPISVTFTPAANGTRTASLGVTDNASGSPQAVSLTGTGVQPVVILSPTSLTFGGQAVGLTSAPQSVTLSNTGTSPVSISSIYTSGGDFRQSNNCPSSVAAGANCTISVTFTPFATGVENAFLYVVDNSVGSPQSASLTGKGITAPGTYSLAVGAAGNNGSSISHSVPLTVIVQ
jgi:subtilase family serine protease